MIWKIISSIIFWIFYLASAISIMVVFVALFRILIWDHFKRLFKIKMEKKA